jgi:hypothetical protein
MTGGGNITAGNAAAEIEKKLANRTIALECPGAGNKTKKKPKSKGAAPVPSSN